MKFNMRTARWLGLGLGLALATCVQVSVSLYAQEPATTESLSVKDGAASGTA